MEKIEVGDTVWLKSGSPKMGVEKIAEYNGIEKAACVWYENGKSNSAVYALVLLTKEDPNAPAFTVGKFQRA